MFFSENYVSTLVRMTLNTAPLGIASMDYKKVLDHDSSTCIQTVPKNSTMEGSKQYVELVLERSYPVQGITMTIPSNLVGKHVLVE